MAMTSWSRMMGDMTEWTRCLVSKPKEEKKELEVTIDFFPPNSVRDDDLTSTLESFSVVKFRPETNTESSRSSATEPVDNSTSSGGDYFKVNAQKVHFQENEQFMENFLDRDYDINPTKLYVHLRRRQWNKAIRHLKHCPHEAKIWTYRKEDNGPGIRWRLTPLLAAIVYQSPFKVVEALLEVYPEAAALMDDQGSLPIHLAHKRGSPYTVVKLLLDTYPDCADVKDYKGRTPTSMAGECSGPNQRDFVRGYKEHIQEQKKYTARLDTMLYEECTTSTRSHGEELRTPEEQDDVENMESDVTVRTHSKLTKDIEHFNEKESTLLEQVMALDRDLKRIEQTKSNVKARLVSEIAETRKAKELIQKEKEMMKMTLEAVVEAATAEKKKLEIKIEEQERSMKTLQYECELARERSSNLEQQLKERENNERLLASTITSALARFQSYRQSHATSQNIPIKHPAHHPRKSSSTSKNAHQHRGSAFTPK